MVFLQKNEPFPDVANTDPDGLLAVGGELSVERLLEAYQKGVFPWYSASQPILWWCPESRMVLFPEQFIASKSLRNTVRKKLFTVTFNTAFQEVITACSKVARKGQKGTWITPEMQRAFVEMHHLGHALSVEVWQKGQLVGGLYGVDLPNKKIFCGESMFHTVTDASKVGFYHLVKHLQQKNYCLIDCQVYNKHLASLGAIEISREKFLTYL